MQIATFRGRRGIDFQRALPACVPGWRLTLDKPPLFPVGHAYANIVPDASGEVLGVLYEVGEAALGAIDLTEGVLIGNYARVPVRARALGGARAETFTAHTLTSDRRDPTLAPSTRYMALLIEGALEHGLPGTYVDFLRAVPAVEEGMLAQTFRPLLDQAMASAARWRS